MKFQMIKNNVRMGIEDMLQALIRMAFHLGADDISVISAGQISVEDNLARMCREPQCEGFGQTINCPPHVMPPDAFRALIRQYEQAVVFKIDVPMKILMTEERHQISRKIHEMAANLEQFAAENGCPGSRGFAAGSCKPLFCNSHEQCRALDEDGSCRYPGSARPSMSGFGINVFKIAQDVGWEIRKITKDSVPEENARGMLTGMVLVG